MKKLLILSHRYLGIGISLLAIMWFATGITMMYVGGMPQMTPALRLERMPELDLSRVTISPAQAEEIAGGGARVQLLTVMDRPAYRISGATVFADTGEFMEPVSVRQAKSVAARFMQLGEDRISHVATLTSTPDQWTLAQGRSLPLHRFRVDDAEGTELYVRAETAEVTTLTTRKSRAYAWISTIPHFLYFEALRNNQPLWYRLVVWTSGGVMVLGVLGLILGITQWRRTRPFNLSKAIPYSGWMRWHYITGVVFGVFTVTWAFSGMLSMEPFAWTNSVALEIPRDAISGGPLELGRFARMEPSTWDRVLGGRRIKEVEFARVEDAHYYVVRQAPAMRVSAAESEEQKRERLHQPYYIVGSNERDRVIVTADTLEVRDAASTTDSIARRLAGAVEGAKVTEATLLTEYDSYYYSKRGQTPLPVVRVKFDDPGQTWVYIDPELGQVLSSITRLSRVERWAYNGLHSLDFSFWYTSRAWDVGMIVLLLGGLATSCFGFAMGVKRIRRGTGRLVSTIAAPGIDDRPGRAAAMTATKP
jgi:uncharacterized iron-regulated membrane protein